MSKELGLLMQSVITFIIGLVLASQGAPSSPEDATLQAGKDILLKLNESSDSETVSEVTDNSLDALQTVGWGLSVASVIEFIGMLVIIFKKHIY